ncbi:MAG: hypothetical protein K2Q33_05485 [Gammaproteobacteria bacterium]|nr:hypothetical protein [Gammaproteobacteria bacterium]
MAAHLKFNEMDSEALDTLERNPLCEIDHQNLKCPISNEIIRNPASTSDGFVYEESYIKAHINSALQQGQIPLSPVNRAPLYPFLDGNNVLNADSYTIPSHTLKSIIQSAFEHSGTIPGYCYEDSENSTSLPPIDLDNLGYCYNDSDSEPEQNETEEENSAVQNENNPPPAANNPPPEFPENPYRYNFFCTQTCSQITATAVFPCSFISAVQTMQFIANMNIAPNSCCCVSCMATGIGGVLTGGLVCAVGLAVTLGPAELEAWYHHARMAEGSETINSLEAAPLVQNMAEESHDENRPLINNVESQRVDNSEVVTPSPAIMQEENHAEESRHFSRCFGWR